MKRQYPKPDDIMYDEFGNAFIFRMYITKNGRRIRRKNGKPFKIPV